MAKNAVLPVSVRARHIYKRKLGTLYAGDSFSALNARPLTNFRGQVQLVFTSPPFPLNRKKKYGNLDGEEYVEWLASYGPLLKNYLKPDGSIVIEVGNGWDSGQPTVSTLAVEALLALKTRRSTASTAVRTMLSQRTIAA
jgi:hypothetical protein